MTLPRFDWTIGELQTLYDLPLMELISRAHLVHIQNHPVGEVQMCCIISIKTGGCQEDCKYCAQAGRYQTAVKAQPMMSYEEVMAKASQAVSFGATRICLGAAWRSIRDNKQFEEALRIIRGVASLGVEVCCTFGMLEEHQAKRLKDAGVHSYNHNLDTSENFYKAIVTTHTYQDRINTLNVVQQTGLHVCCGGILGMGESVSDRLELLLALCTRKPHPSSVPINRLEPIPGTPLEHLEKLSAWELARMIALARIVMPKAMVRLSGGRPRMSMEEQALCFFAGANSIHAGEKLLTIANKPMDQDEEMFRVLGLTKRKAYSCVAL